MAATPAGGAPTEKRLRVRADLTEALRDLLDEGAPYADVDVATVARRAGISRTAFYFYFRDKREVLESVTGDLVGELFGAADSFWSGHGVDRAGLHHAIEGVAAIYRLHGSTLRAIVELSAYDSEMGAYWRTLIGRFVDAAGRRIVQEQESGLAPPSDAAATAHALVWGIERTFHLQLVGDPPVPWDRLVTAQTDVWMRSVFGHDGLGGPASPPSSPA